MVVDWPKPATSVKDVERFLGVTRNFRKYIRGYGTVSAPIADFRKECSVHMVFRMQNGGCLSKERVQCAFVAFFVISLKEVLISS